MDFYLQNVLSCCLLSCDRTVVKEANKNKKSPTFPNGNSGKSGVNADRNLYALRERQCPLKTGAY
jgi:hypothetical protein